MTERVLVAGATGCVGWHVCQAFRVNGAEVTGAARRTPAVPVADEFIELDFSTCSGPELAALIAGNGITTIVNATMFWGKDDEEMVRHNVLPVQRILEALALLPSAPRFVHLGTVHEYGPAAPGQLISEQTEAKPATSYARGRLQASRLVEQAARAATADAVVLRVANTIGPRPALSAFFGSLAQKLRNVDPVAGLDVQIADAHRDYVDVRDAAAAVVSASRSTAADPCVNVGSGQAYSIRQLVNELVAASGKTSAVRVVAGEVQSQSGATVQAERIQLDILRARRLLGWKPRYQIAESLRDMYESLATLGGVA